MRRSQMIEHINDWLERHGHSDVWGKRVMANELLIYLEAQGMQPPKIALEQLFPGSGLRSTDPAQYYPLWEKEENAQ